MTNITGTVSSINTKTDLDDTVWYVEQDLTVYVYPVLCPPPDPSSPNTCGTSPSSVMFSIPQKQKAYGPVSGSTLEWYQPIHQVGQALSYPWNQSQLKGFFPSASNLDPLGDPTEMSAAGATNVAFQWNQVGTTTDSIGTTDTYSFNTSLSISTDVNVDIDVFSLGQKTKDTFSFNYSRSMSTLNTKETKIEGSVGLATNIPAGLPSGAANSPYAYDFDLLAFGLEYPPCPPPSSAPDATCLYDTNTTVDAVLATQGVLWAGPTIDLPDRDWWGSSLTGYISRPDVALNHPGRWALDGSQSMGPNCILDQDTSAHLCYVQSPNSLQPAAISESQFYQMKGFFVTSAVADASGNFPDPQGPQTQIINADGQVWLQTRVHNYSFVATGANRPHVRFYAQEWDHGSDQPLAGTPSVLIDEVVVDRCIPGHGTRESAGCSQGGDNNWVLAKTRFDPTAHGIDPGTDGTYVIFWVLVWLEDSNGNLVPETVGHGLTGLPGNLTSLTAAGALSETYGNNLGVFQQQIFVCPPGLDCADIKASGQSDDDAAPDTEAQPEVRIARLDVARKPVAVHEPAPVRARLRAGEVSPRGVHVALYEGDPEVDGRLFDVELASYLRGNDDYLIRTTYRPDSCGPRDIHVVADPGGRAPAATAVAEAEVSADPRTELRALSGLFARPDLPRRERRAVEKDLRHAALAFRRGKVMDGFDALEDLRNHARRSEAIPANIVGAIEARIDAFSACVFAAGGELAHTPRFRYRRR